MLFSAGRAAGQTWSGASSDAFWTTGANWLGGTAPANNGTAAIVFLNSSQTSPDLNTDYSIASLQFIAGADSYTLNSSSGRTLTVGGLISSGDTTAASPRYPMVNPQTVNVALALSADTLLRGSSNSYYTFTSLVLNGPLNTAGHYLNFITPTSNPPGGPVLLPVQINGVISGSGGIDTSTATSTYGSTGELLLTGANTYTGVTNLTGYGTLALTGNNAALLNTSAISLGSNTRLLVGDRDSTAANPNRINDAARLRMAGGEFVLTGSSNAAATHETIGAITLAAGNAGTITVSPGYVTSQAELAAASLSREQGAVGLVRGNNLGAAAGANTSRLFLATAPTLVGGGGAAGSTTISIVPYLIGGVTTTDVGSTFLTYGATGLRPLDASTEFAQSLAAAVGTPAANVHSTASETLAGSQTINSLLMSGVKSVGNTLTIPTGGTLTVSSGAILGGTTDPNSIGGGFITGGTLNFGTAEGVVNGRTIASAITGSGGLTLAGNLSGANTYTGVTSIYSTVSLVGSSPLGAAGAGNGTVVHQGGSLLFNAKTATINDDIQFIGIGNGASQINAINGGAATFNGDLTVGDGSTPSDLKVTGSVTFNGGIRSNQTTGTVPVTFNSSGSAIRITVNGVISDTGGAPLALSNTANSYDNSVVVLTAANTYRGGTTINNSTLVASNVAGSATGTGNVVITAKNSYNLGGMLAGKGRIDPADGATVQNYGAISPGNFAIGGGTGELTIGSAASPNDLIAYGGSSFLFHLGYTGSDKLTIFGGLNLAGPGIQISILDAGNFVPGNYTLITYSGTLTGPFSNLTVFVASGIRGTLVNDMANHAIEFNVTAIPEPSAVIWTVLSGALAVGAWRRSRRRMQRV